jgi:hypothetical protein
VIPIPAIPFFNRRRAMGPALAAILLSARLASAQSDANVVKALTDMANLETGLSFVELDLGFYVPLEALDDVAFPTTPAHNHIDDGGGAAVVRPGVGRFDPQRALLSLTWGGPYVTYQPGTTQEDIQPYDRGSPLDPWGMPYLFFSPLGLLRGDSLTFTQEFYGDQFDRYAIVSLGPDRVMSGDDLVRLFNGSVTTRGLSSISGAGVTARNDASGSSFTAKHNAPFSIRGYRLAAGPGERRVLFGATELTDVSEWTDTRVTVRPPLGVFGTQSVVVEILGSPTNALELTIRPNAAAHWMGYR